MGFLDKLFGSSQPDYPALDDNSPAATHLKSVQEPLENLAQQCNDNLEIVPAQNSAYVFIGKPPEKFGIAWIEKDGRIVNFKTLVDEQGLSVASLGKLSSRLKDAYTNHQSAPRFSSEIGGRKVVVTPAAGLIDDVRKVIQEVVK